MSKELDDRARTINRLISIQNQERSEAIKWWNDNTNEAKLHVLKTVAEICESDDPLEKIVGCFAHLGVTEIELTVEAEKGVNDAKEEDSKTSHEEEACKKEGCGQQTRPGCGYYRLHISRG